MTLFQKLSKWIVFTTGCLLVLNLGLLGCQSKAIASEAEPVKAAPSRLSHEEMADLVRSLDRERWSSEHVEAFEKLFRNEELAEEPGDHVSLLVAFALHNVLLSNEVEGYTDAERLRLIDEEFVPHFQKFELQNSEGFKEAALDLFERQRTAIQNGEPVPTKLIGYPPAP